LRSLLRVVREQFSETFGRKDVARLDRRHESLVVISGFVDLVDDFPNAIRHFVVRKVNQRPRYEMPVLLDGLAAHLAESTQWSRDVRACVRPVARTCVLHQEVDRVANSRDEQEV
jgi:hypothetical protein